jgi:hypothetical protein
MAGTLEPRERGGPIQKFWEDPLVLSQLESIKTWLTKNIKKVKLAVLSNIRKNILCSRVSRVKPPFLNDPNVEP